MDDRRKIKRRFLMYYSRIYDAGTQDLVGHLGDITARGLMMISGEPLQVGVPYQLKLELSEDICEKPFLNLTARSRWCLPDVAPGVYNTGFETEEIAEEDLAIVEKIIEMYGFRDNG